MLPTKTEPIQPMVATVVGTSGGLADGTVATTPHQDQPNVVIRVVTPLMAILVRFANNYVGSLLGLISLGTAGKMGLDSLIPPMDFLTLLRLSLVSALIPPIYPLLKDCITVLGGLERKFPLLTGSV